jgi:hypothetical protein
LSNLGLRFPAEAGRSLTLGFFQVSPTALRSRPHRPDACRRVEHEDVDEDEDEDEDEDDSEIGILYFVKSVGEIRP